MKSTEPLSLSLSLPFIYVFAYPTDRPTDRVALHILAYLVLILPFEKCILTCFLRFANDEVDGHSPSLLRSRSKASRHSRAQKVAEDAAMDCGLEDECSPGKATATGGWGGRADTVDGFRKYPIVNRVSYIHVGWCRISSINSRTETTHGTDWVKFHDVKTSIGVQEVYSVCLQFWIAHRLIKVSYTHTYTIQKILYTIQVLKYVDILLNPAKSQKCVLINNLQPIYTSLQAIQHQYWQRTPYRFLQYIGDWNVLRTHIPVWPRQFIATPADLTWTFCPPLIVGVARVY